MTPEETNASVSLIELRQLLVALRRLWWLPAMAAVVLASLATLTTIREPTRYDASTALRVNQLVFGDDVGQSDLEAGRQLQATYAYLARGDQTLLDVKAALNLDESVAALRTRVRVRTLPEAPILVVTVRSEDPETARRIAAGIADVLVESTPSSAASPNRVAQIERLDARLVEIDGDIQALQTRLTALSAEARQTGVSPERLLAVQREARSTSDVIDTLESSYADLRDQRETLIPIQLATVVESASVSGPIKRSALSLSTALAGLAGLFIGALVALGVDAFDRRVRSAKQAEQHSGLDVLGTVLLNGANDPDAAESFRMLRTRLGRALDGNGRQVIVLAGASATPAASRVVAGLAFCIADAGITVAVIDANLRKPVQSTLLGARPTNRAGLTELLETESILDASPFVRTGHPLVSTLPVHGLAAVPDLLVRPRLGTLLDEISRLADVVLCDVPAGIGCADPFDVSRHADAVVVVASLGTTSRDELRTMTSEFVDNGAKLLGVVLTGPEARLGAKLRRLRRQPRRAHGRGREARPVDVDVDRVVQLPRRAPAASGRTRRQA